MEFIWCVIDEQKINNCWNMMMDEIGTDVNQIQISSLSKIRGQKKVTDLLKINLEAHFQNRQSGSKPTPFGPVLLCGPSGTGKTLVSKALHAELGNVHLIETNGEMLASPYELICILLSSNEHTTVFIDECQGMNSRSQHILLTALSEGVLYLPGRYKAKGDKTIPLEPFTLIMATTHEFYLQDALRNRIRTYCRFEHYSIEDLAEIIRQRASALKWALESDTVLFEIAKRSKKTPRIALNRNLQQCWNICSAKGNTTISMNDANEAFRLLQIDDLGLDELERRYLRILQQNGSMALNVISSKLALPSATIQNVVEPYLLLEGLIVKNKSSHREITALGYAHIEQCEL